MNPDYDYQCPPCKVNPPPLPLLPADVALELAEGSDSQSQRDQHIPSISSETESGMSVDNSDLTGPLSSNSTTAPVVSQWQSSTNGAALDDAAKTGNPPAANAPPQHVQRVGQKVSAVQSAGKIARKRITGPAGGAGGRPKGSGKNVFATAGAGAGSFNRKANKVADFNNRKRGPKPKMRGVFGAPGVGLQRPLNSSGEGSSSTRGDANNSGGPGPAGTNEGEPCLENKLVLCSAADRFVVDQDTCAMCGSFGLDQEGRLIACAQCGQCYHPYCASVKVNKVILQKGWRCLDW